jgi:hypothetical protein
VIVTVAPVAGWGRLNSSAARPMVVVCKNWRARSDAPYHYGLGVAGGVGVGGVAELVPPAGGKVLSRGFAFNAPIQLSPIHWQNFLPAVHRVLPGLIHAGGRARRVSGR